MMSKVLITNVPPMIGEMTENSCVSQVTRLVAAADVYFIFIFIFWFATQTKIIELQYND